MVQKIPSIIKLVNVCALLKTAMMFKLMETTLTGMKSTAVANANLKHAKQVNTGIQTIVVANAHPKDATVHTTLIASYVHAFVCHNSVRNSSNGTQSGVRASACLNSAL